MAHASSFTVRANCVNCGGPSDRCAPLLHTRVRHECHLYGERLQAVSCPRCGLVFINPRPPKPSVDRLYSQELYDRPKAHRAPARPVGGKVTINDLHRALVQALGAPPRERRILDIGAYEGRWLSLFDASNDLVGIEPSAAALRPCRPEIELIRSDLETAAFDRPFQLVTATALIEHLYDPRAGLVKMNSFLEQGGHLFLYTPDIKDPFFRRGVAKYFKIVHLYYFSLETLSSLLRQCGFDTVASGKYPATFSPPLVFPQTGSAGSLWVLARKTSGVDPSAAVAFRPSTGEQEYAETTKAVRAALARDRLISSVSAGLMQARRWRSRALGRLRGRAAM